MTEPYRCPECGRPIKTSILGMLWHLLNQWHNPITAAVNLHRINKEPIWRIVAIAVAACGLALVGAFFVARWLAS